MGLLSWYFLVILKLVCDVFILKLLIGKRFRRLLHWMKTFLVVPVSVSENYMDHEPKILYKYKQWHQIIKKKKKECNTFFPKGMSSVIF